jgi:hypothetical protein
VGIGGAGSKQDGIRVPGDREYGRAERFLEMLGYPPVILLFKVADSDDAGAGSDSEFLLIGRPAYVGCRSVDAEENEGGLPAGRGWLPNEGIAI